MRKLITLTLILASASLSQAQSTAEDYFTPSKKKLLSAERVSASISAGAGVSFLGSSKNTAFTTFVAPKIGYQLNERLKLNLGLMHYSITGNTYMAVGQNEALINPNSKNRTGNLIFAEGEYLVNKKISVNGGVMVDANNFNNSKNNYKAVSLGMDYKVSKHSSIGFKAIISEGDSPYRNGSFGGQANPMMFDSFGGIGNEFGNRMNAAIR